MESDGKISVNIGDKITVRAQGMTVRGTVLSACYWGGLDGWHIEIGDANVQGGYSYWKQRYDGGKIVEVNGMKVE